jgi:hypothetical protein
MKLALIITAIAVLASPAALAVTGTGYCASKPTLACEVLDVSVRVANPPPGTATTSVFGQSEVVVTKKMCIDGVFTSTVFTQQPTASITISGNNCS